MPINWEQELKEWQGMLDKPKNAGLKAGPKTGISQAIREVKACDDRFQRNISTYHDLIGQLDALMNVCAATDKKHGKLFTEACGLARGIGGLASSRKASAKKELEETVAHVKNLCNGNINELRHSVGNQKLADDHWKHFTQVVPGLCTKIASVHQHLEDLQRMGFPGGNQDRINDACAEIQKLVNALPHA